MKKITNVCTTVYEVITVEFDIPIILFELFACGGEFCENWKAKFKHSPFSFSFNTNPILRFSNKKNTHNIRFPIIVV